VRGDRGRSPPQPSRSARSCRRCAVDHDFNTLRLSSTLELVFRVTLSVAATSALFTTPQLDAGARLPRHLGRRRHRYVSSCARYVLARRTSAPTALRAARRTAPTHVVALCVACADLRRCAVRRLRRPTSLRCASPAPTCVLALCASCCYLGLVDEFPHLHVLHPVMNGPAPPNSHLRALVVRFPVLHDPICPYWSVQVTP
jgi:hypothetical protein